MKQTPPNSTAEHNAREIRRKIGKQDSSEENIRTAIFGLRGAHSITKLCWR